MKIRKFTSSKLFIFIITFLASFVVWYYYAAVVSPNTSVVIRDVPVVIDTDKSVPYLSGLQLTSQNVTYIDVTVSCSRYELSQINKDILSVTVDLSSVTNPGTYNLNINVTITKPDFSSDVAVIDKSDSSVLLTFEERANVYVPIKVSTTGDLADNLSARDAIISGNKENILISGPKSLVEKIAYAGCTVDINGVTRSKSYTAEISLYDLNNNIIENSLITKELEEISFTLPIFKTKTLPLALDLTSSGTDGHRVTIAPVSISPSSVTVVGEVSIIDNLTSILLGKLDFSNVKDVTEKSFDIVLPQGLEFESSVTSAVATVDVSQVNTKVVTIPASQIKILNKHADDTVTIVPLNVDITLFGNKSVLGGINEENINAYIDLENKNYSKGKKTVNLYVTLNDYASVDILYKYTVAINVK